MHDRAKRIQAKNMASQGASVREIASKLQVSPQTVRDWARTELAAFKAAQVKKVKALAVRGKDARQISQLTGVPERTVYHWAEKELKSAVSKGRRKRWGRK